MFEVWAPLAQRVSVEIDGVRHSLSPADSGWFRGGPAAVHGTDYVFRLDDGPALPDPRSRWQPDGIEGHSRVYSHDRYDWRDGSWRGRDLRGAVIYELHVGTFTPSGTFSSALSRLDHLSALGVDFVELLPVAPVPGSRNWGYDGVDLWAVNEEYGGPDGLKLFVDGCHRAGLAVLLDVVYNHLGPSGNYLASFGPYFHKTAASFWGQAVNLDGPGSDEVRRYFIENALSFLRDYHIDGLRLDAVHALHDARAVHFLEELAASVDALACSLGRPLTLIAESDLNDPQLVSPPSAGGYGLSATWDDDVHHALHAALTGERHAYYVDFGAVSVLAKVLTSAYLHDGSYSAFRGRSHGRPVSRSSTPGYRFVCSLQNHDQVGNRPRGERLPMSLLKVGAGLLLTSPFTPMLFMGEEWGAATPWLFFTDHADPALASEEGARREREFAGYGWDWDAPDPQDEQTFLRSKLDWSELALGQHQEMLSWYRSLTALRRRYSDLSDPRLDRMAVSFDEDARWIVVHRGTFRVVANLGDETVSVQVDGRLVLASAEEVSDSAGSAVGRGTLPPMSLAILASSGH